MNETDELRQMCYCGCVFGSHHKPSFSYGAESLCRGQGKVCEKAHIMGLRPVERQTFIGETG